MTDFLFGGMVQANTPINITSALVAANVSVTGTGLPTVGIFSPSTNQLGFATNSVQQMVIDTNGNMGLSTASPGVKLDVSGAGTMGRFTSSTTDSSIAFANSNGGTSTYIGNGGTNAFYVSTNGAERMRIDSSGNVGIGISSPAAKLDVRTAAGTAVTQYLYTGSSAAAATLQFAQVGNVGWNTGITAIGGHFQIGIDTGGLGYNINRNGLAIDYHSWLTAGAERMRIDANGNMGLGTSSPGSNSGLTTRLDVVTANGTATRIGLAQSGINSAGVVIPASVGGLAFEVGATERMRIDSSGNVGFGTSSLSEKLTISTASRSYLLVQATNANPSAEQGVHLQAITDATHYQDWYIFQNPTAAPNALVFTNYSNNGSGVVGGERMRIDSGGRVLMPYQPCFYAYAGSANPTLSGTAQVLVFTYAATNIGSNYSTSNGRFTAPVAGNYIFHWFFVQMTALTGPIVYLYKNGVNVSAPAIAYGTAYNNAAASAIITLAASDYVQLYGISFNSTSPVIDMNYSGFSGHLIG